METGEFFWLYKQAADAFGIAATAAFGVVACKSVFAKVRAEGWGSVQLDFGATVDFLAENKLKSAAVAAGFAGVIAAESLGLDDQAVDFVVNSSVYQAYNQRTEELVEGLADALFLDAE